MGPYEYQVDLNSSPLKVDELNDLPIKTVNGAPIYIRDVAHVRDGYPPQTNIVRVDGARSVLQTVLKKGNSSATQVVADVKAKLPAVLADAPFKVKADLIADQSLFVKASINGVFREGAIAACLTGLMILIFLGSWRSTIIIAVSIPLSVLCSIIALGALGQTINIMTLGGLALAVGISGGRCHSGSGKHQPEYRSGERNHPGHSGRRFADRRTGARLDAFHMHRIRPDVLSDRRPAISVRSIRGSGGVRDARVLSAFADACADDGAIPPCRPVQQRTLRNCENGIPESVRSNAGTL